MKASARRDSGSVKTTSISKPNNEPTTPDHSEMPSASPARPCLFISKPSMTVAAAEFVPGVRMRIAGMEPPYSAPMYTDASRTIADIGSIA